MCPVRNVTYVSGRSFEKSLILNVKITFFGYRTIILSINPSATMRFCQREVIGELPE